MKIKKNKQEGDFWLRARTCLDDLLFNLFGQYFCVDVAKLCNYKMKLSKAYLSYSNRSLQGDGCVLGDWHATALIQKTRTELTDKFDLGTSLGYSLNPVLLLFLCWLRGLPTLSFEEIIGLIDKDDKEVVVVKV